MMAFFVVGLECFAPWPMSSTGLLLEAIAYTYKINLSRVI